ncbi:hypothetical protein [Trebonia sp.]|uniref:hypothetical protein n=1 Tax=Trebonia sp. TaxID=2767075 RepID=UPI002605B6D9|nr:hypothetical protein [Trebonia sp.]
MPPPERPGEGPHDRSDRYAYIAADRCKSGKRWFWVAAQVDRGHQCDDPVCVYGGPHLCGWEDTEDAALAAMRAAMVRLGGQPGPRTGTAGTAAASLKRINAARRRTRPPKPGAASAAPVEYLYIPCTCTPYDDYLAETRRWVEAVPVVRKTARRLYYDTRRHEEDDPRLGYIDRQVLERDGKIWIPGGHHNPWWLTGTHFYATREAAEDDLYRRQREQERKRQEAGPELRRLRMEMAAAHPDRGGTNERFIAAREAYERALQEHH